MVILVERIKLCSREVKIMKVSVVSGGFDPIHSGHCLLNAVKEQGDILIVAPNSDAWLTNKRTAFYEF